MVDVSGRPPGTHELCAHVPCVGPAHRKRYAVRPMQYTLDFAPLESLHEPCSITRGDLLTMMVWRVVGERGNYAALAKSISCGSSHTTGYLYRRRVSRTEDLIARSVPHRNGFSHPGSWRSSDVSVSERRPRCCSAILARSLQFRVHWDLVLVINHYD